jgi:hypothetical protein
MKIDWILALVAVLVAGLIGTLIYISPHIQPPPHLAAEAPSGQPGTPGAARPPVQLEIPSAPAVPAALLDVHDPAAIFGVVRDNAWLGELATSPLGQGFLGSWAGFLGTRGEDLGGAFGKTLADLLAEKVLGSPFRVVWFSGEGVSGAPAVVVPDAPSGAIDALETLEKLATSGTFQAIGCPDDKPKPAGDAPSEPSNVEQKPTGKPAFTITRLLVAERAIYEATQGDTLVLASRPLAVLNALCAKLPAAEPKPGVAVDVHLVPNHLGREAQLLAHLVGVTAPRLSLGVDNKTLVPRGIAGALADSGHLTTAPLADSTLKLLPETTPVVLSLQLNLPKKLDAASLATFFKGDKVELAARQAVLAWFPHGDERPSEIALVWSNVADQADLAALFAGNNTLVTTQTCGQLVLASSQDVSTRFTQACNGKTPSLAHASGPLVNGWKAPTSLGLGVHVGRVLSQLLGDAFVAEQGEGDKGPKKPVPPEIEAAQKQLESLPFLGFQGAAQGGALVPGGFRS